MFPLRRGAIGETDMQAGVDPAPVRRVSIAVPAGAVSVVTFSARAVPTLIAINAEVIKRPACIFTA
ncbi:hypothetical protein HNQ95_006561 [Aminobacter ciceronei]|uniref:Uncharacterized protein n=2 Tax=Aminobacter TaxID=31988 RepID=A0AAC8YMF4_AMIAI|nr:hypothetical protein AA2016_1821 [Aminobacter aminovorans]MBA8910743.1 hypothetical protein [Aminobacter ciceronei]MBA9024525.1 hypothetical protein [Aminobacter ciceronei]MBB3710361.1 hypothetical protein [Aminobacter aminovorans]